MVAAPAAELEALIAAAANAEFGALGAPSTPPVEALIAKLEADEAYVAALIEAQKAHVAALIEEAQEPHVTKSRFERTKHTPPPVPFRVLVMMQEMDVYRRWKL